MANAAAAALGAALGRGFDFVDFLAAGLRAAVFGLRVAMLVAPGISKGKRRSIGGTAERMLQRGHSTPIEASASIAAEPSCKRTS